MAASSSGRQPQNLKPCSLFRSVAGGKLVFIDVKNASWALCFASSNKSLPFAKHRQAASQEYRLRQPAPSLADIVGREK
jgi:hypothetical protein